MTKLTSAVIQLTGENHVELWLSENGYSNITKEILQPNETEIRASGPLENIMVHVKTFVHPTRPFKLSEYEAHKLSLRAFRQKNAAYAAYVVIDESKELVDEIVWERINR